MKTENPVRRSWPAGQRVVFKPNAASMMMYRAAPAPGALGNVIPVSIGSRKVTYLPGPGGGLVYVAWDKIGVMGVSPIDLQTVKAKAKASKNPAPSAKNLPPDSNPVLTAAERRALPLSAFADPKNRRFPIHDMEHARAAVGKLNLWYKRGHISKDEYKEYYQRMMKAYSRLGMTAHTPPLVPMPRVIAGKKKSEKKPERRKAVGENPSSRPQQVASSIPLKTKQQAHSSILVLNNLYLKGKITDDSYRHVYELIAAAWKKFGIRGVPTNELEATAPSPNPTMRRLPVIQPYSEEWRKRRGQAFQSNPAMPTDRDDPTGMRAILRHTLSKPNPVASDEDPQLAARMSVPEIGMTADAAGKNICSLSPEEYYDTFLAQSGDPDAAMARLEDMASWGVTDEI